MGNKVGTTEEEEEEEEAEEISLRFARRTANGFGQETGAVRTVTDARCWVASGTSPSHDSGRHSAQTCSGQSGIESLSRRVGESATEAVAELVTHPYDCISKMTDGLTYFTENG